MGGRPCQICASAANLKLAAEMIAAGASDQAVASKIGGINRMTVSRHRHNHIEAPAKALVEAAGKGSAVRQEREKTLAAVEAGDPLAFVALAGIVSDLKDVHHRLARTADAAEQDNQRLAVSALSAQQLRAAEVRAKLGGVGAYAPPKAGAVNLPMFALNFHFSGGRTERIAVSPVIDGDMPEDALPDDDSDEEV